MIKITIERIYDEQYTETVQFKTSSVPTDKTQPARYTGGTEVLCAETWEPRDVVKSISRTATMLSQSVAEDAFDLPAVIKAINKL